MGCVEFNRTEGPSVGLWEQPARRFLGVGRAHPRGDVPSRPSGVHVTWGSCRLVVPAGFGEGEIRGIQSIDGGKFSKLHALTKLAAVAVNWRAIIPKHSQKFGP